MGIFDGRRRSSPTPEGVLDRAFAIAVADEGTVVDVTDIDLDEAAR